MQRVSWIFVLLVALMTACSIQIESNEPVVETGKRPDSVAVAFRAYVTRGTSTKAGAVGELTTDSDGSVKLRDAGFGVFGYYGDGTLYDESLKPEFMYNQKVAYDETAGAWSYKPIKFWPNETSGANASGAADRLSFFAYAPHVAVSSSSGIVTGDATSGIVGTVSHATPGDPYVKYIADLVPGKGVDLCWAEPFIDQTKPASDTRLGFVFNHSLAQLNVQIDTDVDVESHATSSLADGTHIYVRSVSFTGFTTRGALNLNSPAALPGWHDISGKGMLRRDPVTIYDGRSDGYEGMPTGVNPNETPATLNPQIIQSAPYAGTPTSGVTNTAVNLFDHASATAPLMVIPIPGVPLTMTIVYDVETADDKMGSVLSDGTTHGLSTEHHISRTIQLSDGRDMILSSGKKYVVNAHLGLVSVKFDASIGDWENGTPAEPDIPLAPPVLSTVYFTPDAISVPEDATSVTKPVLTIQGDDGSDLSGQASVVWESSDTDVATIDADGDITLLSAGTTNITARVTYGNVTKEASFALTVTSAVTPAGPLFRGYDISKGILKKAGSDYVLSDEDDQLKANDYYKVESSLNVYYHQWFTLREYFGYKTPDNIEYSSIDYNSDKLPYYYNSSERWSFPSWLDWDNILLGAPKEPIIINGLEIEDKAFILITVNLDNGNKKVYGLLLFPDDLVLGSATNKVNIKEEAIGDEDCLYSDNVIDEVFYESLINRYGCIFLPSAGYFQADYLDPEYDIDGWDGGSDPLYPESWAAGSYLSGTLYPDEDKWKIYISIGPYNVYNYLDAENDYYLVRLVKKFY